MGNNIVKLHGKYYASCPCGGISFHLLVDDVGDKWKTIFATECIECDARLEWIKKVERIDSPIET